MNKQSKTSQQQPPRNEQQQETDIIRKRFELYDSLFSKFEEKISKLEGIVKKKPTLSQNAPINEERSQAGTPSNSSMNSSIKRFEDKVLDLKVQFEKKFLSQEEKFKAIMNRLERYETIQEQQFKFNNFIHEQKIDQEIKSVEINSNQMIQNLNSIDEKVIKLETSFKVLKINGFSGNVQGGHSNQLGLNLTEEFVSEMCSLNNMVKQCNSNFNNLHNQVKQIEKQIEKSPSRQNGNTPTQNKKKSRINGIIDENDKPLLTFQDTNRKFFGEQSSSKKLGEKLLNQEESQDKHLISYNNSPNFASSNVSPLNKKQPLSQIVNINQQQNLLLQQQITPQQRIHQQNVLQPQQNQSSQRMFSNGNEQINNNSTTTNQNNYNIQQQQQIGNKSSQNKLYTNNQTIIQNQQQTNYQQLNNSSCISSIKKNLNEEFETKRTGRSNSVHDNILQGVMMKNIEIDLPQFQKQIVKYDYYFENNSTKSNRYSNSNISSNSALNTIPCQNENISPNLVQKRLSLKPPMSTLNQKFNEGSSSNLCLNQEQMIHINPTSPYTPSSNFDHINRSFALIEEKKRKIDEEIEKRIREESQKRDKIIGTVDTKRQLQEQPPTNVFQEMNKQFKHTPKGTQHSRTKEMQNRLSLERKFEKQAIGTKKQTFEF